ncbi:hypothetical protein B0I35DRAFT_440943 [Stachybotrys elegans]|uniref:Lipase-like C-terminal domain-containing protein n=1 Tax=Stachybotrys elegans TaxID=80388 RepID=A0A8K0SGQ0_9HYPO|nr:hypothetical protein B0I35DRAFT_440943 [Stachybotrys elegans]
MDPTTHPIDAGNEGIRRLQAEVSQIRARFSGPLQQNCPIVLVPGFSGWGRPLLGTVNYFGGFEDLPLILSQLGYIVIVVRIGPISTNRERACEIFAQLTNPGGFDLPGALPVTFIPVNFGTGLPAPNPGLVAAAQTLQAVVYDSPGNRLPATWQWGPSNRVNFICHSQGGTTIRYLIELLSGTSDPTLPQFLGTDRQPWVKSVVTLGTPHKGTTVTEVVNDLLPPGGLDPLIDFITSCSFESRSDRIYDLHLDHWGFFRTPGQTYQAMRALIAPTVNTWWNSRFNGLYDNSIRGIRDLDGFAPRPSRHIYYFTMSFCATRPFPKDTLTAQDINGFLALFPLNGLWNPLGAWGYAAAPFQPPLTWLGILPSLYAALTWITNMANRHLQGMGYFSQVPLPGTEIPRPDVLPLIMYPAYAMGGRRTVFPGIPLQESQRNDGIVNTLSMDGPSTGRVNYRNFATAPTVGRGIYWNLGTNTTIDHADQIGVFTDSTTV